MFATGDDLEELRKTLAEGVALMLARASEEPPTVILGELSHEPTVAAELVLLILSWAAVQSAVSTGPR